MDRFGGVAFTPDSRPREATGQGSIGMCFVVDADANVSEEYASRDVGIGDGY